MKGCFTLALSSLFCLVALTSYGQSERIKYGDFESWITREIKESMLVGGKTRTLYEVGPTGTFNGAKAYKNQGGSPWATSNVYANVCGVTKTNVSVYPDSHKGGKCAKLCTQLVKCKAVGVVNITVLAAGSLYLGEMLEPIKNSSDPMSKMSIGMPFTRRPRALKFDYKFQTPEGGKRIRETGFSKRQDVAGPDYAEVTCLLQKRWEDAEGGLHASRVGTMKVRFNKNTNNWVEAKTFPIHYGDFRQDALYEDWMGLVNGEKCFYAKNSKGKNVPILEEDWADADETPTHIILKFDSSHGEAYVGTIGNTLWVDNVELVY